MANILVDPDIAYTEGLNHAVIRDANNFVYVFVNNLGNIRAYKGNVAGEPTSFTEQDAVGAPDIPVNNRNITAKIDSNGLVHVAWLDFRSQGRGVLRHIKYGQFRTSAHPTTQDDWVLEEDVVVWITPASVFTITMHIKIAIDVNNDPHICYNDEIEDAGAQLETIFYLNRIGGSWSSKVEVQRVLVDADVNSGMDFMIADPLSLVNADRPIVAISFSNGANQDIDVFYGNALNATSFVEAVDVTGTIQPYEGIILPQEDGFISMAIDSNEKITIAFVEKTTFDLMVVEHLNSKPWGTWETPVDVNTTRDYLNPSITIEQTNRFIFAESSSDDDIRLFKAVNGVWTEETADPDLPNVGTFFQVRAKWAAKFNNTPKGLDYAFIEGTQAVFYNTLLLVAQAQIDLGDMVVTDSIDLGDMILVDSIDSSDMVLLDSTDFGDMVVIKSIDFGDNTLNKSIDLGDMVTGD